MTPGKLMHLRAKAGAAQRLRSIPPQMRINYHCRKFQQGDSVVKITELDLPPEEVPVYKVKRVENKGHKLIIVNEFDVAETIAPADRISGNVTFYLVKVD